MRAIIEDQLKSEAITLRLGVKVKTVGTQVERVYAKLGIHSCVGLAVRLFSEYLRLREEQRGKI